MSAIKHALDRLDGAIDKLESSVRQWEKNQAGRQVDMFPILSSPNAGNPDMIEVDGAVMAQKLDQAIKRVEDILRDG